MSRLRWRVDPRKEMMIGSDWPVCLLATNYSEWFDTVGRLIGSLSTTEKERNLGRDSD